MSWYITMTFGFNRWRENKWELKVILAYLLDYSVCSSFLSIENSAALVQEQSLSLAVRGVCLPPALGSLVHIEFSAVGHTLTYMQHNSKPVYFFSYTWLEFHILSSSESFPHFLSFSYLEFPYINLINSIHSTYPLQSPYFYTVFLSTGSIISRTYL